jgi:hypothetical protein
MIVRVALVAALATVLAPACSLGNGSGSCSGTLDVPDCWSGSFNLHPDFFAAVPPSGVGAMGDALQLRIQRGGDYPTFSDGLIILIDDAGEVRGDPASDGSLRPSLLGQPLVVALPPGVAAAGTPVTAKGLQSIVHAQLYLDATCRTQNDALYALDAVTVHSAASGVSPCSELDGGDPPLDCNGGPSPGPVMTSTITFNALFDANPGESNTADLLSDGSFHLFLADPREICPGGLGPPPRCRGELFGNFHFYFQRGAPAQPFP